MMYVSVPKDAHSPVVDVSSAFWLFLWDSQLAFDLQIGNLQIGAAPQNTVLFTVNQHGLVVLEIDVCG